MRRPIQRWRRTFRTVKNERSRAGLAVLAGLAAGRDPTSQKAGHKVHGVTLLGGLYWLGFSSVAAKLRDSPAAVSIDRSQGAYPGRVILMECVPGLSLMRLGVLPT